MAVADWYEAGTSSKPQEIARQHVALAPAIVAARPVPHVLLHG
ncbi:hypothetical protein ACFQE5_22595 [Pseudonocardia hispaniensis]|uniref:Uncharacterized protein n=1 Tax=Pseudonocardia hispaniensis TaxID=904933 RepID=A0ABW1J965_9PSEU